MANMAYCRFENTAQDLKDCAMWLRENQPDDLGSAELAAFKRLLKLCIEIADNYRGDE